MCWHGAIINQEHHIYQGEGGGGQSWARGGQPGLPSGLPPLSYLRRSLCSGTP